MKPILLLFLIFPLAVTATDVSIQSGSHHPSVGWSIAELKFFLDAKNGFHYTNNLISAEWIITLKKDSSLAESAFTVRCFSKNKKQYIELSGAAEKDIPCAVYTFLEKLGYTFEFDGFHLKGKL